MHCFIKKHTIIKKRLCIFVINKTYSIEVKNNSILFLQLINDIYLQCRKNFLLQLEKYKIYRPIYQIQKAHQLL